MVQQISQSPQAKNDVPNDYSFRVVCSECGRTVIEAGKDGKITEIICDKCEGIG